jgi:hypothetical protein
MLLMVLFYYQQLLIILKLTNLSSLLGVVTSAPQASVLATLTGATAALSQFTLQTTVHLRLRLQQVDT